MTLHVGRVLPQPPSAIEVMRLLTTAMPGAKLDSSSADAIP